jgi:hypothetical protein
MSDTSIAPSEESFQAYLRRHDLCGLFAAASRMPPATGAPSDAFLQCVGQSAHYPNAIASVSSAVDAAILNQCGASRPVQVLPPDCTAAKLSPQTVSQLRLGFAGQRILLSVDATGYGGPLLLRSRMEQIARFIHHLLSVAPVPTSSGHDVSSSSGGSSQPQLPTTKIVIAYTDRYEADPAAAETEKELHSSSISMSTTHVGFGDPGASFFGSMIDTVKDVADTSNSAGVLGSFASEHLTNLGTSSGIHMLSALLFLDGLDVIKVKLPTSLLEPLLPFHESVVLLPNMCHLLKDSSPRYLALLDPILAFCDVYVVNSLQQFVHGGPIVNYLPKAIGECYLGPRAAADAQRLADIATSRACKLHSREVSAQRPRVLLLGDMDELSGAVDDPLCDVDASGQHCISTGKFKGLFSKATSVLEHVDAAVPLLCTKFDLILLGGVAAVEAWRQLHASEGGPTQNAATAEPSVAISDSLRSSVAKLLACVAAQAAVAHPTFCVELRVASDFCIIKKTASGKAKASVVQTARLAGGTEKVSGKFFVADVGPATRRAFHDALRLASAVLALGCVTCTNDHVDAVSACPASGEDMSDVAVNASVSWMHAQSMRPAADSSRPVWTVCGEVWAQHCLRLRGVTAVGSLPVAEALSAAPKFLSSVDEHGAKKSARRASALGTSTISSLLSTALQQLEADAGVRVMGLPYALVASMAVGEPLSAFLSFPAPIPTIDRAK